WSIDLNRNQNLLGKCVIVLKRSETDVSRLTTAEWTELLKPIGHSNSALDSLFRPDHATMRRRPLAKPATMFVKMLFIWAPYRSSAPITITAIKTRINAYSTIA